MKVKELNKEEIIKQYEKKLRILYLNFWYVRWDTKINWTSPVWFLLNLNILYSSNSISSRILIPTSIIRKQLYNVYEGKLVKFQPDNTGTWHAYEVNNPAKEVPTDVLRNMRENGLISKAQYNKWIKNK